MHDPPASPPTEDLDQTKDNNDENLEEETPSNSTLQHKLQPGDHVIRWEMLPIVYPIQIHGIVLECGEDYVKIIDFGLTSYQQEAQEEVTEEESAVEDTDKSNGIEENVNEKSDTSEREEGTAAKESTTVEEAKEKDSQVTNDEKTPTKQSLSKSTVEQTKLSSTNHAVAKSMLVHQKSRLNITTIRDQKEVNAWKRVNYGENLFSKSLKKSNSWWKLGSIKNNAADASSNVEEEQAQQDVDSQDKNVSSEAAEKASNCNIEGTPKETGGSSTTTNDETTKTETRQSLEAPSTPTTMEQLVEQANQVELSSRSPEKSPRAPSSVESTRRSWWKPPSRKSSSVISSSTPTKEDENDTPKEEGTSTKPGWWKSWTSSSKNDYQSVPMDQVEKEIAWADAGRPQLSQRHMNPAMSSLMTKSAASKNKGEETTPPKPQQKLPKADPPKVVLARTRFLLEHGESVLPPYHVFASNSECIAVWCMTGRWSTLQASVFLHSTAIGHAKTATAITLGVAATQPWLVPALAVVGGAAVGMPWIILKRSKDRWEAATQELNDLFWAQAEPEVFVECIEKWSKFGSGSNNNKIDEEEERIEEATEEGAIVEAV